MKAVTWHGVGDIRFSDVPDPKIQDPTDAIVKITTSAICGTDLHMVRGTMPGLRPGVVLGHEAVGEVVEIGPGVRNLSPGDRVIVPSTIACGYCSYCRAGYFAQCDNANPGGKRAGTAFFGGPEAAGGFDGLQAEYARVPYASVGLVPIPDEVGDEQAVMLSDIWPTAWFGARLADVRPGETVAVFGAGPVGQLAVLSAYLQGAGRVIVVDGLEDRLAMARAQHAEVVNFNAEDPVETIVEMTGGIGVDKVVDAVGVDAERPAEGPATEQTDQQAQQFDREVQQIAPETDPAWAPGDAPSLAAQWAVQAVAKAGTLGVIGVYPQTVTTWPFGEAMMKNLTIRSGNCHHRKYIPELLRLVTNGTVDPAQLLTKHEPMTDVLQAYRQFQDRDPGWLKVALTS
ncbi:threonine dehydrogenase-like Zn-dependent dehydrogenase [Micromonospora sp. M71_S20]|uniref:zinc-dependent alcohol dehydrogenase n=1 Tax=Micromonospora sp. M71_S20 TaxID=592872 RepID=UPI000EB1CFAE|nr:zinc-dependent alcohol dehydrogenase [Micromonospora sp. M71_S20]RLK23887.1 threonine dehydrogenase-like Zn-dependent dehydrogenase [Micromonospora sp. M71_S20]